MIISTNPLDKLKKHRETSREIRKGFSKYPRNLVILFCLLLCSFEKPRGSSHQRTIKQIVHFNFTALVLQGKWKLCSSVCKSSRCLLPSCSYFSHSQWCSANPSGLNSGVTSYPSRSSPESISITSLLTICVGSWQSGLTASDSAGRHRKQPFGDINGTEPLPSAENGWITLGE